MKALTTSKNIFLFTLAVMLCCIGWVQPAWGECIDPSVRIIPSGGDYCGNDLTISGTVPVELHGKHYNVGVFKVEDGATLRVPSVADGGGQLEIHAVDVIIEGLIDANSSGWSGGLGGGGARSLQLYFEF